MLFSELFSRKSKAHMENFTQDRILTVHFDMAGELINEI